MQKKQTVKVLMAGALVLTAGLASPGFAARTRPNVIIILADDLGFADVGFNGCRDIPTPHIDSLAHNGVRFTNGYVTHPYCSPTRAALMTGRYQQRFGHETNPAYEPQNDRLGLPVDQVTLADAMRKAGYATGIVGKWHLGAAPQFHPNRRGFDDFFGFVGGGHQYLGWKPGPQEYVIPLMRNQVQLQDIPEYLTDTFSREAVSFVERHRDKPFFLYLAYNAVHGPYQAPQKYLDRFPGIQDPRRRAYAAMNSAMDDGIGQLLAKLRELQLEEDTLLFFLSDNGGPPPAASPASNGPLRGHKGTLFEGGIHVPFVAQWKGTLAAGTTCEAPVSSLDLFPTAGALAGAPMGESLKLEGTDLLPYLTGRTRTPPHALLFWRSFRLGTWAVRDERWKLVQERDGPPGLYDLSTDIGERTDVATAHPDVVERLTGAYAEWNRSNINPLWDPPRANAAPASKPGR